MSEKNIRLTIEYDGSSYSGWQYQPDRKTIQGEIELGLKKLTGQNVTLYAAGRTDAGVHALGQVANFIIEHHLPVEKHREGLNFYLPDDILIRRAEEVSLDFNARYDAVYRHYEYLVGRERSAINGNRRWELNAVPRQERLNRLADVVRGEHDFSTFCVVSSHRKNNRCLVYRSIWRQQDDMLKYEIIADRFLHTMIRSLVGLMIEAEKSGMTIKQFNKIFKSGDHTAIKKVAPARGLYLVAVGY